MSAIISNLSPTVGGGLVGWWKMDEGNGLIAHDASGNENHGTLVNSPTWVQGIHNGALSFNGSNNYIMVNNSSIFNPTTITICFWIKLLSNSGTIGMSCVDKTQTGDSAQYRVGISQASANSVNRLFLWNGSSAVFGVTQIPVNSWTFCCMTISSGNTKFYVNGIIDTSNSASMGSINSGNLLIGRDSHNPANVNGLIDEVRIYNRALTQAEITTLYQSF